MLWDKASLVSVDNVRQFYVDELQPFVSMPSVSRQPDGLHQQRSGATSQERTDANNVPLYGSTQLAVDLAELAAEAGNETLTVDVESTACTQLQAAAAESSVVPNGCSDEKVLPSEAPIALDGFCLESSSVSFSVSKNMAAEVVGLLSVFVTGCRK